MTDLPRDQAIRTHLANERTFLAWIRTAISLVALGIGVAAFLNHGSDAARVCLAIGALAVALALVALGFHRYAVMREQIEHGERYQPYTRAVAIAATAVAALTCGAAVIVALRA